MRTTIDLPEHLVERVKISAAKDRMTMRELVIQGLEKVLAEQKKANPSALARLKAGYDLGGKPLSREEVYERS